MSKRIALCGNNKTGDRLKIGKSTKINEDIQKTAKDIESSLLSCPSKQRT